MNGCKIIRTVEGQSDLPRYFKQVFSAVQGVNRGEIRVTLPDGRCFGAQGSTPGALAQLHVHNPELFSRLVREGSLGFSDAYLDEWWSTTDLQAFMNWIHTENDAIYDGFPGMGLVRAFEKLRFWLQRNHKTQAKKNISYHYDLGNEFYEQWLDGTMTYSSALFETGQESLETAQLNKYARIVDEMAVRPGDHVLEIGCGWGGFAEYAASRHGLKVTGLTISKQQLDYARERIRRAGLDNRVDFKLLDYRDEQGSYDGVASIEMLEAVGQKYWPSYFHSLRDRLKPGKRAAVQTITIADRRWEHYSSGVDFIQKYIFPGGMLPSPSILEQQVAAAGLDLQRSKDFGSSYNTTLLHWHQVFNARWEQIAETGFDERFRRMWNFYLTSCAANFDSGNCNVSQLTIRRPEAQAS